MNRLTDRRTAEAVRENIEKLQAAGVEPSISDVRYVKLAEYEDVEEDKDVQPAERGRWLPSDSYITTAYGTIHYQICSECGADLMEDNDYDYDFCPVCGAKVKEDS